MNKFQSFQFQLTYRDKKTLLHILIKCPGLRICIKISELY